MMNEPLSFRFAHVRKAVVGLLACVTAFVTCAALMVPSSALAQPVSQAGDAQAASSRTSATTNGAIHIFAFDNCDAILVESNGLYGMIDSGEDSDYPSGNDSRYPLRSGITIGKGKEEQVVSYLKRLGVNSSNFVFYLGTHAHSDHIGSADEIIREFEPDYVYTPLYDDSYITNSSHLWDNQYVYDNLLAAAAAVDAEIIQQPTAEQRTFTLGNLTLQICNYRDITDDFRVDDANDYCWGVKVSDGISSAFLAGDINNVLGSEDALASEVGEVDLLKLGHHGHENSSTPAYLSALSPQTAVLTGYRTVVEDSVLRQLFGLKCDFITSADATAQDREAIVCSFTSQGITYNVAQETDGVRFAVFNESPYVVAHKNFTPIKLDGWAQDGDIWYWFDNSSTATEDEWIKTGGAWYHLKPTAEMATGWVQVDGTWYYCGGSGAMQTGWQKVKGVWYYLDGSGAMRTGWQKIGGTWYYLDGSGAMQTGWVQVDGVWYYLDGSGAMLTGWQKIGGAWYYLKGSGAMATGWQSVGGTWYYLKSSGAMATGWVDDNGTWYYCNGSGAMQTGWLKSGGTWCYLNSSGAMAEGWKRVGGAWYYLAPGSGAMRTGWIDDDGTWYYANGSGAMQTGWLKTGGHWYYLKGSGAMATGWQRVGGIWYYLSDSGAMVTGERVIEGVRYTFDSTGAWIGSSVKEPPSETPSSEAPPSEATSPKTPSPKTPRADNAPSAKPPAQENADGKMAKASA